jgi:hypothetical protein
MTVCVGSASYEVELEREASRLESEGRPADARLLREQLLRYVQVCEQLARGAREFSRACGSGRH